MTETLLKIEGDLCAKRKFLNQTRQGEQYIFVRLVKRLPSPCLVCLSWVSYSQQLSCHCNEQWPPMGDLPINILKKLFTFSQCSYSTARRDPLQKQRNPVIHRTSREQKLLIQFYSLVRAAASQARGHSLTLALPTWEWRNDIALEETSSSHPAHTLTHWFEISIFVTLLSPYEKEYPLQNIRKSSRKLVANYPIFPHCVL